MLGLTRLDLLHSFNFMILTFRKGEYSWDRSYQHNLMILGLMYGYYLHKEIITYFLNLPSLLLRLLLPGSLWSETGRILLHNLEPHQNFWSISRHLAELKLTSRLRLNEKHDWPKLKFWWKFKFLKLVTHNRVYWYWCYQSINNSTLYWLRYYQHLSRYWEGDNNWMQILLMVSLTRRTAVAIIAHLD